MEKLISILQNIREEGGRAVVLFFCLVSSYLFFSFDIYADIDWKYWNEAMRDVRESVDFTASTVFPSGNYPTRGLFPFLLCSFPLFVCLFFLFISSFDTRANLLSDDGTDDKLVQWCHGAPAAVLLFCKAFEVSLLSCTLYSLIFCSLFSFFLS